uniref:WXG100 family type VII secretion target n=1 Tax=Neobacillus citreus TaxID=2833578 RepID=A0A942SYL8_9BACI
MQYDALGFDPAPGEPDAGREMVRRLRAATEALGRIDGVVSGSATQDWHGQAATAFQGLLAEDLQPRVREAHGSFERATRALDTWVSNLDGYRERARALEAEAETAKASVASAHARADGVQDLPDDADDAARAQHASDVRGATAAVNTADSALADVLRRAHALAAEATSNATTAAAALETAMSLAPDAPGLLDRIGDALDGIGDFLADAITFVKENWWDILHRVVNIASTVLSIASIFFPALAPFALGFAIADVAMSGWDALHGRPGAAEAFATGALGLVGGFAVGKLIGAFTQAAGPVLANGPFRAVASGAVATAGPGGAAAASQAGTAAAALTYNPAYGPALTGYMVAKAKDATDARDGILSLIGGNTYYDSSLSDSWRKIRAS